MDGPEEITKTTDVVEDMLSDSTTVASPGTIGGGQEAAGGRSYQSKREAKPVVCLPMDDDSPATDILFVDYKDESQLDHVMKLVIQDLSEPYSSECKILIYL